MTSTTTGKTALFLAIAIVTFGAAVGTARAREHSSLHAGQGKFLQKAAADGMAEVELGQLAKEKAMREEVRQFGDRMVTDHGKANDEVKAIAAANNVQLPAGPDKKQQKDMDKLRSLSGPEFDRAYMKHMLHDHKEDVKDFRKQAKAKKPNDVSQFAAKTLPTLEDHLRMAQVTYDIANGSKRTGDRETGSKKK